MQLDFVNARDEDDELERIVVAELGEALEQSLATLPDVQREAIRLRVLDELPYDLVAARLNCSIEAARMRVMRGLKTIRTDLAGRYP